MQRQGLYPPPPGASLIPGLEVSGLVVKTNSSSSKFRIGDKVCALLAGGGYAEYCTAPEEQVLKAPAGLTMIEAAAIPETFFTVWANLFATKAFSSGEKILIHGGASGIGTTAIQLAIAFGAKVYTTAGSDKKCSILNKLGIEKSINYKKEDFVKCIKKYTNESGVDVILDIIGGEYFDRNLKILSKNGRLIILAFQGGYKKNINLLPILRNHLMVTGSTLRPRTVKEKGKLAKELYKKVWPLIENKIVRPIIYKSFSMKEVRKAHMLMERSEHIGKIVLKTIA
jgi:putative PIG3 family NAD(P)H quinone oxidoreductase